MKKNQLTILRVLLIAVLLVNVLANAHWSVAITMAIVLFRTEAINSSIKNVTEEMAKLIKNIGEQLKK